MTARQDDSVKELQRDVQRLLGRCLLRIQEYEHLLKALVTHHEISGTPETLEANRAARKADTANKTLGTLVGSFLGSVIVSSDINATHHEKSDPPEHRVWVSARIQSELPDADYQRIKSDLKEFVQIRNDLVHHFIEEHDIRSAEGCRDAHEALITTDKCIDQHLKQLREWAEEQQKLRRTTAEYFQSEEITEFLVNGISPEGTVHWPLAGIVYSLRAAAGELAVDGWTCVVAASKWIAEREPEQTPAKYGCSSWRQVVHMSPAFELRNFEVDGQRSPRYREKDTLSKPN